MMVVMEVVMMMVMILTEKQKNNKNIKYKKIQKTENKYTSVVYLFFTQIKILHNKTFSYRDFFCNL